MDEIVSTRLLSRFVTHGNDFVLRLTIKLETIGNIVTDGTGEKDWLLLHDSDLAVVPLRVKLLNVPTVKENFTMSWIIETLKKRDD